MSLEGHPELPLVQRTFAAESLRAVCAGVLETALATFTVFIAVTVFESGPVTKSILLASPAIGLLGSLVAVPLVARTRMSASHASALFSLISAAGFAVAAIGYGDERFFVIGMTLGIGVITMGMPLQTHYLRRNYPGRRRGRLFSVSIFIRAATTMIASWGFGEYLDRNLANYPVLLWSFVGAAMLAAVCQWLIPSDPLRSEDQDGHGFFAALRMAWNDRVFFWLLVSSMILGIGVLSAMALRVDYLVNPEHGLQFDVKTVSLITGVVPSVVRLISTFFWGWLFDRINFLKLRIAVNTVFLVGILLYYVWPEIILILIGSAFFGLGRGGGEIFFNLFVTKLAKPEYVADYMSVHTFMAGVRTLLTPFFGFFLVQSASIPVLAAVSAMLVIVALVIVKNLSLEGREDSGEGRTASQF